MNKVISTPEIPATDLFDQGILEIIKTPTNERYLELPWRRVNAVTVGAMVIESIDDGWVTNRLFPHLRVYFRKYSRPFMDFSVYYQEDGSYEISTVSGTNASRKPLSEDLSKSLDRLLLQAIDLSNVSGGDERT